MRATCQAFQKPSEFGRKFIGLGNSWWFEHVAFEAGAESGLLQAQDSFLADVLLRLTAAEDAQPSWGSETSCKQNARRHAALRPSIRKCWGEQQGSERSSRQAVQAHKAPPDFAFFFAKMFLKGRDPRLQQGPLAPFFIVQHVLAVARLGGLRWHGSMHPRFQAKSTKDQKLGKAHSVEGASF